ncbi:hypothetical protein HN358_03925 [Candidatus Uhrbacteria bacterium]|jgi:putative transposase|nr:hypothetical protein [Candidatus Uhrbacteria bacterium]MBT7716926.1 hypothetical protein [Candidatus Uhrbacteria bacterium]
MRREQFANGNYYHIYNRGVDKRCTFQDQFDYEEFIEALKSSQYKDGVAYVDINYYCLMDNHFHLVLRQGVDRGVSDFMHKIGTKYTEYFNQKYKRTGCLFEGPYRAKPLLDDAHFLHISRYVHLNPLKYHFNDWKLKGVRNIKKALDFLKKYQWSSYSYIFGKESFISTGLIADEFKTSAEYDRFLIDWIRYGSPIRFNQIFS